MKKQLFQHKKFTPAILSALIAVSLSASTALANPSDCPPPTPNDCRPCIADDVRPHNDRGAFHHERSDNDRFDDKGAFHHERFANDRSAKYLAESFALDEELVQSYLDDGWHLSDLKEGALIAKVSGNSFETVLEAKDDDTSWREVASSFHVTKSQLEDARFDLRASHMAERLDMSKHTVKALLKDGYHPRDIAAANAIAKKSDTPLLTVLSMREINNTWQDVAKKVGLSPQESRDICAPEHPSKHHRR